MRPGIVLTAERGLDGLACKMSIKPRQSLFLEDASSGGLMLPKAMSAGEATAIVDEVVPPNTRGAKLNQGVASSSWCNQYEEAVYENVEINRSITCNVKGPGRGIGSVNVTFHAGHCSTVSEKLTELPSRYGTPAAERFMARPGIRLDVEYGSDGGACEMRIEPGATPLSFGLAKEIMEEAIPPSARGGYIDAGGFQTWGGMFNITGYWNVKISYSVSFSHDQVSSSAEHVDYAGATFTRAICQNLPQ